ncbi:MAG: putative ABC exporter domain-containing protein, partial [Ruminococcus sp.]|nr:putative ABC exporter domain-containing protein [Ruminococcus sp.]
MSALFYLLFKKAKNRIKEMFRRPSELIAIVIFVLLGVFTIVTGDTAEAPIAHRSIDEFYAIVLALY